MRRINKSREDCILEIKKMYATHGKVTRRMLLKETDIQARHIDTHFGGIIAALEASGVPVSDYQTKNRSKDSVVADIMRVIDEHGYISKPIYEKYGLYNQKVVRRIFGSFSNMYAELGLDRHPSGYVATDNELLKDLKQLYKVNGSLSVDIIKRQSKFSVTTYMERFGSINNAYKLVGAPERQPSRSCAADYEISKFEKFLGETATYEKTFDWLVNPVTGRSLRLDAYFPGANIAVEYNGRQHYEVDGFHVRTQEKLLLRQSLDSLKEKLLHENGITLIIIRYDDIVDDEFIISKIGIEG